MFLSSLESLGRTFVIAILAYAALVLILRLSGKRTLAKLNAFDLVVTVALGSSLATVLLSRDVPLVEGVLAFAMLAGLQFAVAKTSLWFAGFREVVRSDPILLVDNGRVLEGALRAERVVRSELEAAIRKQGIGRIEEVAAAVLESDGSFSVIRKEGEGALTALASVKRTSA